MLTDKQGHLLLRLARQEIEKHLDLPPSDPVHGEELHIPALLNKQGVFVTLHKKAMLRGCIGSLSGVETIAEGISHHAINAAFHDHRFPPVNRDEVAQLHLEISVLSEPAPLAYKGGDDLLKQLQPQVDGVILKATGGAGATFLPQVWQQLPTPELFLSRLCQKAGLADDAWRTGKLEILTYKVQHFEEPR